MFLKFEMYLETAVLPRVGDRVAIGCLEKLQLEPGRVSCKCYLFKCFNVWIQMFKVFIQMLASLILNVFTLEGWGRQWSGQGPPFSSGRSGRLLSTHLDFMIQQNYQLHKRVGEGVKIQSDNKVVFFFWKHLILGTKCEEVVLKHSQLAILSSQACRSRGYSLRSIGQARVSEILIQNYEIRWGGQKGWGKSFETRQQ